MRKHVVLVVLFKSPSFSCFWFRTGKPGTCHQLRQLQELFGADSCRSSGKGPLGPSAQLLRLDGPKQSNWSCWGGRVCSWINFAFFESKFVGGRCALNHDQMTLSELVMKMNTWSGPQMASPWNFRDLDPQVSRSFNQDSWFVSLKKVPNSRPVLYSCWAQVLTFYSIRSKKFDKVDKSNDNKLDKNEVSQFVSSLNYKIKRETLRALMKVRIYSRSRPGCWD